MVFFCIATLNLPPSAAAQDQLKYVVIVSRHGVRSPTWDAARLNRYSAQPWPDWGVRPGDLTPHGRELITILGSYYREWLTHEHLFGANGCGDGLYIRADTDQRTVETGRAFAESLARGCGVAVHSGAAGEKDALFSGVATANVPLVPPGADAGKILEENVQALKLLELILRGSAGKPPAWLASESSLSTLALVSSLSEDLLLEYANGFKGEALGWGRLNRENLLLVLELHRAYAELTRRSREPARRRGSNLLAHVLASLEQAATGTPVAGAIGPPGSSVLVLVGHDTNLSNVSGMLNLSWGLAGYPRDETPPGSALIFSLWRNPANGQLSVSVRFLATTLDQMREATPMTLATPPPSELLSIPHCGAQCTWEEFARDVRGAIDPSRVDFQLR